MGRTYAAILGPLATAIVLLRGAVVGASATSTLTTAWLALVVFSALGYVIGILAERTIDESVRGQIEAELMVVHRQDGN